MDKFFKYIEGSELQLIGLWSNSFESLMTTILGRREFYEAQGAYLSDPTVNYVTLKERLARVIAKNENSTDRDPYDTAITEYLIFILKTDPLKIPETLTLFNASRLRNLWWTRYAIELLNKANASYSTGSESINIQGGISMNQSQEPRVELRNITDTHGQQLINNTQRINI